MRSCCSFPCRTGRARPGCRRRTSRRRGRGSGPRPRRSSAGSGPAPSGTTISTGRMPTASQNFPASATSAGEAVIRLPRIVQTPGSAPPTAGRRRRGRLLVARRVLGLRTPRVVVDAHRPAPVQSRCSDELLDDVLPEVVERPRRHRPRRPRRSGRRRSRPRGRGTDLGLGDQLGHRLELALGRRRRRVSSSGSGRGVEALGEPAYDVDRGGELLDRPAVGVLGGDVVDAVEVVAVSSSGVRSAAPRCHDRPHRVVGQVVVGARCGRTRRAPRGWGTGGRERVRPFVLGRAEERLPLLAVLLPRRRHSV